MWKLAFILGANTLKPIAATCSFVEVAKRELGLNEIRTHSPDAGAVTS